MTLLFERFLAIGATPPLILTWISNAYRRDEVIAYVYERYGREHTALVCNVVTYRSRLAVRDAAWALGFPPEELNRVSEAALERMTACTVTTDPSPGHTPPAPLGPEDTVAGGPPADNLTLLTNLAAEMIGVPRHLSVHAGGMLVTAQPLVEVVPLEHATKPGVVVAQWNKDSVEDAGLVKIDLLSLATLSMVSEVSALIAQRHGVAPDLDALPLDDPAVYRLLAEGDTIGCFQVESRAQSSMLPRLKPQCFEDLIIEVSIVRPGPIQGGMVHPYLRRRQGLEPITYPHPSLEPVLRRRSVWSSFRSK